MSNLQRMIVIPSEIFEKIKHFVLDDSKLSELDKNMKSILRNNKLTDLNKWHLYRQNLLNYSAMKRKIAHQNKFKWYPKQLQSSQPSIRHVEGVGVQTKQIYTKNKEANTDPLEVFDKYTQANIPVMQKEYTDMDDQFSSKPTEVAIENTEDEEVSDDDDDDSIVTDERIDPRDILRERASSDPDIYRSFEMKDGTTISVPTKKAVNSKGVLRAPKPGSQQTTLNIPVRKSNRILTVQTIKRSEKERLQNQPWTSIK